MACLANVNKLGDIYLYKQYDILSMFVSKNSQQQFSLPYSDSSPPTKN